MSASWWLAGGFLALAVAWTWPLASRLGSRIPHDPGDAVLNIWLLWWSAHSIAFTTAWWNAPMFYPMDGALALSEHLAGIAVLTTPVQWAGASALTAYNLAFIFSFAASGLFACLLVRRLLAAADPAARDIAGICAGVAYGFGPYRAGQLAHLQVLTSQWMPLALLAMHAYTTERRRRWLVLFAAAWLLQALSNGYYLLFFPVLAGLWLAWFVDWRQQPATGAVLLVTWAVASAPLVPILLTYATVQHHLGLARTAGEMANFSASPHAFIQASGLLRLWPTLPTATTEEYLFPGVTPLALIAAALVVRIRRPHGQATAPRAALAFYGCTALIMWALACGPAAPGAGFGALVRPYTVLTWLPGFDALRVPARFAMLATLCVAVASGLAFAAAAPRGRLAFRIFAAVAVAGLLADGWMRPMPLAAPPGRIEVPDVHGAALLELPVNEGAVDTAAMYRSMVHRYPLVNGYSGHTPPHYAILSMALRRGDATAIVELARIRPLIILVNAAFDTDGRMRRLVEGVPGIRAVAGSSGGLTYVLPAQATVPRPPVSAPWPVTARKVEGFRLELDLGATRVVRSLGFPLRWHYGELDTRIQIQASEDGAVWSTVWEDWTGGAALKAALIDPLEAPVRITLPDLRMRYLRVYPTAPWLQRELNVYGP